MIESKPNFTQIPNFIFELMGNLPSSELVVLLFVCRKIYGWHKVRDNISISQIMEGTNLSKPTVIYALKSLIKKQILAKEINKKSGNVYMVLEPEKDSDGKNIYHVLVKNSTNQMVKNSTIQKKLLNKYKENNTVSLLNSSSYINKEEGSADSDNYSYSDLEQSPEIDENASRIDLETSEGVGVGKETSKRKKPLEIDSGRKLAKPIIDRFYNLCKALNDRYGHETKWDAIETKMLKSKLLEAGLDLKSVLPSSYADRSKENPYYPILDMFWRLEEARDTNPNNQFYKKPFLPSTFSKNYSKHLPEIVYKVKARENDSYEDEETFRKLKELNKNA